MGYVLRTPEWAHLIEADLQQYYGVDLIDIYDKGSRLSVRRLLLLIDQLPDESRLMKRARDDGFSTTQHLLASILDAVTRTAFESSIAAAAGAGKEYSKMRKGAPKPIERPTVIPVVKKPRKFLTTRELMGRVKNNQLTRTALVEK